MRFSCKIPKSFLVPLFTSCFLSLNENHLIILSFLLQPEKKRKHGSRPMELNTVLSSKKFPLRWCQKLHYALNPEARPLIALVSFPGSGNTWLRYLLQQATGESPESKPQNCPISCLTNLIKAIEISIGTKPTITLRHFRQPVSLRGNNDHDQRMYVND